jgi:ribosomal protein S18 acetylase RimI-like enzyme
MIEVMVVRELEALDAEWARDFLTRVAGASRMVSRGRLHECHLLPGFYTEDDGRRTALLTFRIDAAAMEVVSLYTDSGDRGRGYGTALLRAASERARREGCARLWLVTTNDNLPAQRFYRARGMRVAAIHEGAVDAARRDLKPEIPLHGVGGVPIHDEIEFEEKLLPYAVG